MRINAWAVGVLTATFLLGQARADDHSLAPSAGDSALAAELQESHESIITERAGAESLLHKLQLMNYHLRLAALAGAGAKNAAPQGAADPLKVRDRLLTAWSDDYGRLMHGWKVDPRLACRAQLLDLQSAMGAPNNTPLARLLPGARTDARRCFDKLVAGLRPLQKANRELSAAIDETEALLATRDGPADGGS